MEVLHQLGTVREESVIEVHKAYKLHEAIGVKTGVDRSCKWLELSRVE